MTAGRLLAVPLLALLMAFSAVLTFACFPAPLWLLYVPLAILAPGPSGWVIVLFVLAGLLVLTLALSTPLFRRRLGLAVVAMGAGGRVGTALHLALLGDTR